MGIGRPSGVTKPSYVRPRIITPDEAVYSVSRPEPAARIAGLVDEALRMQGCVTRDVHVVDATACVGGDTLALAHQFPDGRVTAVERDERRSRILGVNAALAKLGNVRVLCDDFVACVDRFSDVDALYIDCPWGGPMYKHHDRVPLELSGVPLEQVVARSIRAIAPRVIALKTPFNYDAAPLHRVLRAAGWALRREHVANFHLLIATGPPA